MHIQFINVAGGDYSALDIAITALATYINERSEHRASILDLTFHRRDWQKHLQNGIARHRPDLIGFSTNTMYLQFVKPVMREIKAKYQLPIILGGAHASVHPEDVFALPEADAVCVGDGEIPLVKFLDNYSRGKSAAGIAGIWAKEAGREIRNGGGCFLADLDQSPAPDWDLWEDLEKYFYFLGMLYIQGSRGCPYKCTYCDAHGIAESVSGKYFRLRDPVKYAREIGYLWRKYKNLKTPPRLAQLFDPVFTISEEWLEAFCGEYRRQGLHREFRFSAFSRIDHLDEKKIKLLARSGCASLRAGVEAGDEYIRQQVYQKNIGNEKVREIFKLCRQYGIGLTAYYILGGPGETKKTIQATIDLAVELDASRSPFFIYKPFTREGERQVGELGGEIDRARWRSADNITFGAVVRLKDVSPRQVEWLQKKAYFLTFGRRLLRMLAGQKLKYFIRLFIYVGKGLINGLDLRYLLIYYHIYGYDNVDK